MSAVIQGSVSVLRRTLRTGAISSTYARKIEQKLSKASLTFRANKTGDQDTNLSISQKANLE